MVKTRMTAEGQTAIVTDRSDSSVGIRCDVTELLRKSGPGESHYGVVVRGLAGPLHVKATLVIEDDKGTRQHASPDVIVDPQDWVTAARLQAVSWAGLSRAELRVESGYGDAQDFAIREVLLRK